MQQLYGHSITYRIAIGPHQGRKVFILQSLPPLEEPKAGSSRVAKVAGFSLYAGVIAEAHQRGKLERLCRYSARPAVSELVHRPQIHRCLFVTSITAVNSAKNRLPHRVSCPPLDIVLMTLVHLGFWEKAVYPPYKLEKK